MDYRASVAPVDQDREGSAEVYGAYELRLVERWKGVKHRCVAEFIGPGIWVHIYVAGICRCHVLEEMRALARVDAEIFEAAFYDDFRFGDVAPLAYEDIISFLTAHL